MKLRTALLAIALSAAWIGAAAAQTTEAVLKEKCTEDSKKFCADVQPGGGRILRCLRDNRDKLTPDCKTALAAARRPLERPSAPPPG